MTVNTDPSLHISPEERQFDVLMDSGMFNAAEAREMSGFDPDATAAAQHAGGLAINHSAIVPEGIHANQKGGPNFIGWDRSNADPTQRQINIDGLNRVYYSLKKLGDK